MSIGFFGDFDITETVDIPFNTFSSNDPSASVTVTNLAAGDIEIHKDGAVAQRTSDDGVTVSVDFDGITGNHMIHIDLSSTAVAGYYSAGSRYSVRVEGVTVDAGTLNAWVGAFSVGCTLRPTVDGRTLDIQATGEVDANVTLVSGTSQTANDNGADINAILLDTAEIGTAGAGLTNINLPNQTMDIVGDITGNLSGSVGSVTAQVSADVTAVNGDVTAATNLSLQYNTTGLTGDTFPSTQAQLGNIANVGSAVNKAVDAYVLTTGTATANAYTDTIALNGTRHTHTDSAAVLDIYYEFLIGGGTPSSVTVTGALTGNNDNLEVYGYDWVGTAWVQIGILPGKVSTDNEVYSYGLFTTMVGTGANLGKVRVRFTDGAYTLTSATLYIDQIYTSFNQGTGDYANGAIWVDTNASNTNTVSGVDGTSTNPVSTWAAALTLSAALNIESFQIANGSSITLSGVSDNYKLCGDQWALAQGTRDINGASITGADVTGVATATSVHPLYTDCHIGAATIPPAHMVHCGIGNDSGQFTAGSAGQYVMTKCYSLVPGSASPALVFSGLGATTGINNRGWFGGSTYTLDSNCTLSHEVVAGGGTSITAAGANVEVRGTCRSLTFVLTGGGTNQFVGITGPVTLSGTATSTVNIYGVISSLADSTSAAVVTNNASSYTSQAAILVDTAEIGTAGVGLSNMPWNASWDTEVQSECTDALNAYDPPTKAEMDTAHALLATEAKQDIIDTNVDQIETAVITNAAGTDVAADIIAIKAETASILTDTGTTLPALIDDLAVKKNATFSNFEFLMVLTSDHVSPATSATITGYRSIDGGAFAGVSGTIAEVSNGIYQFDALAADTNGDVITWRFTATSCDDTFVTFKTVA